MPGQPANFIDKTVILIKGNSGIGKSTLSNFLQKDNQITRLCLDNFFNIHFIENNFNKCEITLNHIDFLSKYEKPYKHVSKISKSIDFTDNIINDLVYLINLHIQKLLETHILVIIEGYVLCKLQNQLNKRLKTYIKRIWILTNLEY
jgi:uridine kinase